MDAFTLKLVAKTTGQKKKKEKKERSINVAQHSQLRSLLSSPTGLTCVSFSSTSLMLVICSY